MDTGKLLILFINIIVIGRSDATFNFTGWKNILDVSFRVDGANVQFPNTNTEDIYSQSGRYQRQNILITRMQMYKYDVVFAMPRFKSGVPITLAKTHLKYKGSDLKITPFPNWQLQQEGNCDAIQSAIDIYLDREGILWVLDDGIVDSLETPYRRCPPKVLSIEMFTGNVIGTIDLSSLITENSKLQYIVTERAGNDNDYVYISDAGTGAIITFNAHTGKGRRLLLPSNIIEAGKDALYLTIAMKAISENYLYFTYSDCDKIYAVETCTIRDNADNGVIKAIGRKPRGSGVIFYGTDGLSNIIFKQKGRNEVYMWDSNTPWKRNNWQVILNESSNRQITHVTPGPWKLLWYLESNIRDYLTANTGCFGPSTYIRPITKDLKLFL